MVSTEFAKKRIHNTQRNKVVNIYLQCHRPYFGLQLQREQKEEQVKKEVNEQWL